MSNSDTETEPEPEPSDAELLRREQLMIQRYLDTHPPMSYAEVNSKMQEFVRNGDASYRMIVLGWMAEYGEWNHDICVEIRANIWDYEKTMELGQRIYDRGGFTALQANFYVMKNFLCGEPPLKYQCSTYMFHGVGKDDDIWQA